MCGIAGLLQLNGAVDGGLQARAMVERIRTRGPDDAGAWFEGPVALAHSRLSILDLSPAGHQPMQSASGRYVVVFNGEIYNHAELFAQLTSLGKAPAWRGHSDTEVMLAAIETWGIEGALQRCVGMFAIALWDRRRQELTLARDRLGEKPLYYGWQGRGEESVFLFGSELKALRAHPAFCAALNRNALALYLRHNYIPAPYSIYEGIAKLQPGCILTVSIDHRTPKITSYWSAIQMFAEGAKSRSEYRSADDAVDQLEALLKSVVAQQMVADVPLGAFLSGGIDSSTIVAMMQAQSSRPVKTFTIGFHEAGYNEAEHAKAVARHLGTEHTELYVTPQEAMDVIPRLPAIYDEPFADSSQIPTLLVSELARKHVTVSLSGDAGDELFSGYTRYSVASNAWHTLDRIPRFLRSAAASAITAVSPEAWSSLGALVPVSRFRHRLGDKLHKGAGVIGAASIDGLYHGLVSHWPDPDRLVIGGRELPTLLTEQNQGLRDLDPVERMMAIDLLTYLPDDILVKVDRASMAVSLESRVPMLDHRLVEFAWNLPQSLKYKDGTGKWILRQVLYRHVPATLFDRPKMGFGVPIDSWLRGPLREWAEALLAAPRLKSEGYFESGPIREKWAEHLDGRRNWAYHLWDILMFQSWLEAQTN